MYGQCDVCGKKYGYFDRKEYPPCEHVLDYSMESKGAKERSDRVGKRHEWIGVDFDGTLSHIDWNAVETGDYNPETMGPPIARMVHRIVKWKNKGINVRIFTARVSKVTCSVIKTTQERQRQLINQWMLKHVGFTLPITCEKDLDMIALWDDISLVPVKRNTGHIIHPQYSQGMYQDLEEKGLFSR